MCRPAAAAMRGRAGRRRCGRQAGQRGQEASKQRHGQQRAQGAGESTTEGTGSKEGTGAKNEAAGRRQAAAAYTRAQEQQGRPGWDVGACLKNRSCVNGSWAAAKRSAARWRGAAERPAAPGMVALPRAGLCSAAAPHAALSKVGARPAHTASASCDAGVAPGLCSPRRALRVALERGASTSSHAAEAASQVEAPQHHEQLLAAAGSKGRRRRAAMGAVGVWTAGRARARAPLWHPQPGRLRRPVSCILHPPSPAAPT